MTRGQLGSIYGPRVPTTRQRINFWHGIPAEVVWDTRWELVQQRQRWVSARYGDAAFEDKPLLDGYSSFDLEDGGYTLNQYKGLLQPRDASKIGFLLNQQRAEHDEHHFARLRPFCPTCRGSRIFAALSLSNWLVRHPGRIPPDESDTDLAWDTEMIPDVIQPRQADLYHRLDELAKMPPPEDLFEGVIPRKGVGYITGRDRSLKTFLALDMFLHVGTMMPHWHMAGANGAERPRRRCDFAGEGKVIFAAGEGISAFTPRVNAWVQAQHVKGYLGSDITTDDGKLAVRLEGCQKCEQETDDLVGHVNHVEFVDPDGADPTMRIAPGLGELERRNIIVRTGVPNLWRGEGDYLYLLARARKDRPDMIVVDTLHLASIGADQQSNSEMGLVHERAKALADASDGVVIVIAHTDKGDHDARGASAIEDNADFVLHCHRVDNQQLKVEVAKRKDAEDNWFFMLAVEQVDLGFGQTSLILHDWDEAVYGAADVDHEHDAELLESASKVVLAKRINSFDIMEFAYETDLSRKTVTRHLDRLVGQGELERVDGKRGGRKTTYHFPRGWLDARREQGHSDITDWNEPIEPPEKP